MLNAFQLWQKRNTTPPDNMRSDSISFMEPSDATRDGKAFCPDFQVGVCSYNKAPCPKGLHRCGRTLKGGRVCGQPPPTIVGPSRGALGKGGRPPRRVIDKSGGIPAYCA